MADIGNKTVASIVHMIEGLLTEYQAELTEAYQAAERDFHIPINVKIRPDSQGNKVKVSIKFTKEQVTAEIEDIVDDAQIHMEFTTKDNDNADITGDDDLIMKLSGE